MIKRVIILIIFNSIFFAMGYSLFLFPPSLEYFLYRSEELLNEGIYEGFPIFENFLDRTYIGFDLPIGKEYIAVNTIEWLKGSYVPTNENQAVFDKYNYSSIPWITFNLAFGNGINWEIYMKTDFKEGSTYYFDFGDLRIWELNSKNLMSFALDTPYEAYLNFQFGKDLFISYGRFKKSIHREYYGR